MRKLLLPFSLLYWLVVRIRNWFFDIGFLKSEKVGVPVISVGNISAGGVGKTPFVEMLIDTLKKNGRLAVVSRGYRRKTTGTIIVSDGGGHIASVENSGDEPVQLARKYPDLLVVADEQRVRGARKAIELGARMVLLDDGFQHRHLCRDLDIVMLTADEILKGDWFLPSGNRREPANSLKRANLIVIARCPDTKEFERVCESGRKHKILPAETPVIGLKTTLKAFKYFLSNKIVKSEILADKKNIAFSGIGNPKSFEDLLRKENINVVKHIAFQDHHWYTESDIAAIVDARKQVNAEFILTTEKDAVRLHEQHGKFIGSEPVIVAEIQHEIISGGQKLEDALARIN